MEEEEFMGINWHRISSLERESKKSNEILSWKTFSLLEFSIGTFSKAGFEPQLSKI